MSDVNVVAVTGRVAADPELKTVGSGTQLCELRLAVGRKWKGEDKTVWLTVTCFGKTAEIAAQYLSKGSQCGVSGRLDYSEWQDRDSGKKRSQIKVVCDNLTLLGGKGGGGGYDRSNNQDRGRSADDYYADAPATSGGDFPDDEVPF